MKEAFTLLDISFEDLQASKTLLENYHYPQALFYFQQSVEKATKSIGLFAGALKKEDLQSKIRHETVKVFKVVIKNARPLKIPGYKEDNFDIDDSYQYLMNLAKNNDIDSLFPIYVKQIEQFKRASLQDPIVVPKIKNKGEFLDLIDFLNPVLKDLPNFEKLTADEENFEQQIKKLNDILELTPKYAERVLVLYILCLIVVELVTDVRYPNDHEYTRPSLIFNQDHILIQNLEYLQKELEECIKVLLRIFS